MLMLQQKGKITLLLSYFKIQRWTATRTSQKNNKFIGKTISVHVHHTFLYLCLPFLHYYDVKMPNFAFYVERKKATTKFSPSEHKYVPLEFNFRRVRYIWQSKWVGITTIKTERTQIHFLSYVLVAVASLDHKVRILKQIAYRKWSVVCWRDSVFTILIISRDYTFRTTFGLALSQEGQVWLFVHNCL